MNVWLSNGSMHLWNLVERQPEWPWEAEIDHLMRQQATTLNLAERKRLYDRVQLLVGENLPQNLPLFCIMSPNVLVGGKSDSNCCGTLLDLYRLSLPAELVTLSGCATGMSVVAGGDEL